MNSTFNKDDEEFVEPPETLANRTIGKPVFTSTPQKPSHDGTIVVDKEMNDNIADVENALAGCTIWDLLVMKNTSKFLNEAVKRFLFSDEFEVRRCSTGEIISQGRSLNSEIGGASSEELQRVTKERDQARIDAQKMHENYMGLYDTFNTMRDAANDLQACFEDSAEKLKLAVNEVDEWKAKYFAVRESANKELERASIEYDDLVKTNEENTKMLRLRVKKMEVELSGKDDEITNLKTRVKELTQICDQLINEVDVCDTESNRSQYDA